MKSAHRRRAFAVPFVLLVAGLFLCLLPTSLLAAESKKIVLLAGPLDDHPLETHEYEKNVLLLKHCLETAPNAGGIRTEVHFNGWPTDPGTLDDADTIFLTSGGSDRNESDHPLYVGDRFKVFEKQMKRGCGVVFFHWSTFHPARRHEQITEWVGGYFDYETGPGPRKWYSAIQTWNARAIPGLPDHPVLRGVKPFTVKEEFYYRMRFRPEDSRLVKLVLTRPPNEDQDYAVGWAVQRTNGGRGFGFTGGHFYENWWNEDYRRLVLNAILWTAHVEVPEGGVDSMLDERFRTMPSGKSKPKPGASNPDTPTDPAANNAKSERRPAGKAPRASSVSGMGPADDPTRQTDANWIDDRWQRTEIGPFLGATLDTPKGRTFKGLAIKVGDAGEGTVCFDIDLLRMSAGWTGGFLKPTSQRYGLISPPAIEGAVQFSTRRMPGGVAGGSIYTRNPEANRGGYRGLYRNGKRVLLRYSVADAGVLEWPWAERAQGQAAFTRTFEISPVTNRLRILLCSDAGEGGRIQNQGGLQTAIIGNGDRVYAAAVMGKGGSLAIERGAICLTVAPHAESVRIKTLQWTGPERDLPRFVALAKGSEAPEALGPLTEGGPPLWTEEVRTRGSVSKNAGPFAIDTLPLPHDNPWRALMFASGLDFFDNGDIAMSTAHGDVWRVSGVDADLSELRWKRFATGLHQPLGLKIVSNRVHVLERDRITVLHDWNGDDEADFYENFNSDCVSAGGGHSYATCLETDPEGNFYFLKCAEDTPHGGTLLRVSRDGKELDVVATGFRNPNGLGIGPHGLITAADQQGNWVPETRLDAIRQGGFYGYTPMHKRGVPPQDYDPPLCWIPRTVDNSAGGQVWVPEGLWGPLSGKMIHLSYGRCTMMLVLLDEENRGSQGAVVPLPGRFLSGVMRGRFNPHDGNLYLCGLRGWQTAAVRDGCLQRVRSTGAALYLPIAFSLRSNGVRLKFTQPLDKETAEDVDSYGAEQWNYHWSSTYGSPDFSVAHPGEEGRDAVPVKSARLLKDGRTVFLEMPELTRAMQLAVRYNLAAIDGKSFRGNLYTTVNRLGAANGGEALPESRR